MSSLPIRERVPDRYCRHPQTAAILEALEKQSSISAAQIDHLLKQFFVETATWKGSMESLWMSPSPWRTGGQPCGTK